MEPELVYVDGEEFWIGGNYNMAEGGEPVRLVL